MTPALSDFLRHQPRDVDQVIAQAQRQQMAHFDAMRLAAFARIMAKWVRDGFLTGPELVDAARAASTNVDAILALHDRAAALGCPVPDGGSTHRRTEWAIGATITDRPATVAPPECDDPSWHDDATGIR